MSDKSTKITTIINRNKFSNVSYSDPTGLFDDYTPKAFNIKKSNIEWGEYQPKTLPTKNKKVNIDMFHDDNRAKIKKAIMSNFGDDFDNDESYKGLPKVNTNKINRDAANNISFNFNAAKQIKQYGDKQSDFNLMPIILQAEPVEPATTQPASAAGTAGGEDANDETTDARIMLIINRIKEEGRMAPSKEEKAAIITLSNTFTDRTKKQKYVSNRGNIKVDF